MQVYFSVLDIKKKDVTYNHKSPILIDPGSVKTNHGPETLVLDYVNTLLRAE